MPARDTNVRVAIYGAGSFANRTHIPNLVRTGVDLVAVCDVDGDAAAATSQQFGIPRTYGDGHEMLAQEEIDVLYSCVPAYARTDVEAAAAARGLHLFSEKPQATTMAVAQRIDAAVRQAGVMSTVCFRERYRPLFQEARRLLEDKEVVHIRFMSVGGLPAAPPASPDVSWHHQMEKAGGRAFDWGVHAVDYSRFISGLDAVKSQAFYHHPATYSTPLSCSFNLCFTNGATATYTFISSTPASIPDEPWFTFYFAGGYLAVHKYERLVLNGETVYQADDFDPWFEQDRVFIEAARSGDASGILNDYHDGLYSLAPVLAGWESARRGGELIDVPSYMAAEGGA